MHLRVQRLDAPIQHFREAGVVSDFGDLDAIVGQLFGGAASGQDIDTEGRQRTCKVEYAGLVGNGDEGLFDHDGMDDK